MRLRFVLLAASAFALGGASTACGAGDDRATAADASVDAPGSDGNDLSASDAHDALPDTYSVEPVDGSPPLECPPPIAPAVAHALATADPSTGSLDWLYPQEGTVFPYVAAPLLQWSQTGTPDAVYLHLSSKKFDHKQCFLGTDPTALAIDAVSWAVAFSQSGGRGDPLTIAVATSTAGVVASATVHVTFALGTPVSIVYYDTFGSKLVPGRLGVPTAAVMRSSPALRGATPLLYAPDGTEAGSPNGPCLSCHAVAAGGSMLVAAEHLNGGPSALFGAGSEAFGLSADDAQIDAGAPEASSTIDDWGLSAVYPDGTLLLTAGEPSAPTGSTTYPGPPGDNPGLVGPKASLLVDLATGVGAVPAGLTTPYAMMPTFSADGKHLVYNDWQPSDAGTGGGHSLTVVDFDRPTRTFSNARLIFDDPSRYPGWPSFTPDAADVVFSLGDNPSFASETSPDTTPSSAELYVVDVATATAHRLDAASGRAPDGTVLLPFPARDQDVSFYPAVGPEAVGGYFWVYFTSRRTYGNAYAGDGGASDPGTKATWVSAIDTCTTPGTDPSHPAFYLPGQELGAGNVRPTPALPPCAPNGEACTVGYGCCSGSCDEGKCGVPGACAAEGDQCTSTVPCCASTTTTCVGGYCAKTTCQ